MGTLTREDRNRTIWQRIQLRVEPIVGREQADAVASALLGYVIAERRAASVGSGAFVPGVVLGDVGVVDGQDRGRAGWTPRDHGGCAAFGVETKRAVFESHGSPSVDAAGPESPSASELIVGGVCGVASFGAPHTDLPQGGA